MYSTMMHYRPLIHHQQIVMEQPPYYHYAVNDLQACYSSSDHQEEDNDHTGDEMPSETSGDQSPNAAIFHLEFAATQCSKLVLNAEGLFTKLMSTNILPPNEQNLLKSQIEQWLCMKQEYEECIAGDDSGSLQGYTENTRRSLERIEEVTETDEKTDESNNWIKQPCRKSCSGSESEVYDDEEDQSDLDSENPDFPDKLDEYMKKYEIRKDEIIDSIVDDSSKSKDISPVPKPIINNSFVPVVKPVSIRNQSTRRTSILPYSEMSDELAEFQKQNSGINLQQRDYSNINTLDNFNSEKTENQEKCNESFEEEKIMKPENVSIDPEHVDVLKTLMIDNEEKQLQIKKIQLELDTINKQMEEIQNTIREREQFIENLQQNCEVAEKAKQKFQKKRSKFEEKYLNTEELLNNYKRTHRHIEDETTYKEEIKKYENLLTYYEKKLKDTKIIKQVAGNPTKTYNFTINSLSASKTEIEKFKQRLQNEEKCKKTLEDALIVNQKKIKEIEEKYNLPISKLKEIISESGSDINCSKLKIMYDNKDKSLVEANERVARLDREFKEKLELDKIDNVDEKESLRQEIRNLRYIRDQLIDRKYTYTSGRTPISLQKQRQLLLISEYVEAIDALIEEKNVMICDKINFNENKSSRLDDQMLIKKELEQSSQEELIKLFYKYFYKVIDLKESSKNLEIQNATLEESLKKQEIESDTRMIRLQKSYERQISHLLNYYAEETSSSSYDTKFDRNKDFERLVKENQAMRKRLAYFDYLLKNSRTTQAVRPTSVKSPKQVVKPELMQLALPPKTTKVTREGNKLIILTNKKGK